MTESLSNVVATPFRKLLRRGKPSFEDGFLWALEDVSFKVKAGDAVGIIGRNGAGKTTLLKILSRITEPTEGRALLQGRVASLLEVGTGFHPELTGRENVFLNGAILGMTRSEIRARFDEIVAFAEVDRFMDTPVKRYSSGMQVRLAFSVAAHLEPEILIVDEVLAVGDVAFQRKCLGRMGTVASEGRTVLFVSHNMGTISRLCQRGIWLDDGKIRAEGQMEEVIGEYLAVSAEESSEYRVEDPSEAPGDDVIRLRGVRVRNHRGDVATYIDARHPLFVEIDYVVLKSTPGLRTGFRLVSSDGTVVFTARDNDGLDLADADRSSGAFVSRCEVPGNLLKGGQYFVTVNAAIPNVKVNFRVESVVSFSVESVDDSFEGGRRGVIAPQLDWVVERTGPVPSDRRVTP
ncbi:MAG: ABC transporter ATP-binding protein [bacterium]